MSSIFLDQFINDSCAVKGIDELMNVWTEFVGKFNIEGYRIVPISPNVQQQKDILPDIAHNTPKGWLEHYNKNNFHRDDPLLARELIDSSPFTTKEALIQFPRSENRRVVETSMEFGIKSVLSMSAWFGQGELFASGFYLPSYDYTMDKVSIKALQTAVNIFCAFYKEFHGSRIFSVMAPPCLTPRELDILHWIAIGKTKQEIADHLNISLSCVKRHCENASQKLGTNNMASTVAKAMSYRIISI